MVQSFLITLREGLEAALIVGIVLAYLARTSNREQFKNVWWGVSGAIALSLLAGAIIFALVGEFSGRNEEIFEGAAMLTAVLVLTYMVIWMKRMANTIGAHLRAEVEAALRRGTPWALGILAFVAVGREGLETVLFMFAAVQTSTPLQSTIGGVLGLALAFVLGYLIYKGSARLNLRLFFNITGVLLILFAAGLLAHGVHEWQEAGIIPIVKEHVWDINNILNENKGLGSFLKAVFGYNGNPELMEVIAYAGYLFGTLWYFLKGANISMAEMAMAAPGSKK
ncbi:MAG: FTR1 family protein [Chloroflexi bacterium]|nr:FTR1 family protein [Chloroflexota bacterium]